MRAFSANVVESAAANASSQETPKEKTGLFGFFKSDVPPADSPSSPIAGGGDETRKWGGVKNLFSGSASGEEAASEPQADDGDGWFPALTYKERMQGFGACFIVGYVITFSSFSRFVHLLEGKPVPFVFVYTLGNMLSLSAMLFLCGPARQFRNMFHENRKWTSVIYLSTLFLTIFLCFIPTPNDLAGYVKLFILVILLIVQLCASVWYSLSYIPFARRAVSKFAKDNLGTGEFV